MTEATTRVLLVEDDEDDYVLIRDLLAQISDRTFALDWVSTFDAGLAAVGAGRHDIYLFDYRLGGDSGLDLLRVLQSAGLRAPIILLTAQGDRSVDTAAMEAGAADYLVKGEMTAASLERALRHASDRTHILALRDAALAEAGSERDLLQTLMDTVPENIYFKDTQARYVRVNQAQTDWLGERTPEEVEGKTDFAYFPLSLAQKSLADDRKVLNSGQPVVNRLEDQSARGQGNRWMLSTKTPIVRDGQVAGLIGISRDITDLRQAEEALHADAESFRLLVGSIRDCAIYMLDLQGHVISWNEGAQRINQYAGAEIIGRHFSIFYTIEDQDQALPGQSLRIAAETGHYEAEGWRVRMDGSCFWAEVHITAILDAQTQLSGFCKVTRDLTEPRRVEAAIQQLNTDLEQRVAARTADLATANIQLQAINQELEAFAYSVSHDLRTPLRAISGFSNVLLTSYSETLDLRGQHYLQRIHAAAAQMGHLIDDLLGLSRLTRSDMHTGSVDLTDLARAVADALQQTEPERAVTWDIAEGLMARGDASLLRVVLDNLLANAWKFTSGHATARIEVGMRQDEGETIYFVRDDGAGFDMAYADKLFGAFQRLHTVREFTGTGIGLATVQRIIHRHGGRVWAQGAVEQGTTISFTLAAPEGGPHAAGE
jgi:PAS domain S-box-containing protein